MPRAQHEIPTHLNVEDRILLGLTVRQFLYLLVGFSLSYGLWDQPSSLLPPPARAGLAVALLLLAAAFALLRPLGRPLEEWVVASLFYAVTPKRATWRPPEPEPADWRPAGRGWQQLAPSLAWREEEP